MVARGYAGDSETPAEALNHGVALWTVDDLVALLRAGPDLAELRALFAPGPAADRVGDLLWAREHGVRKRLAVICDAIRETAWAAQVEAAVYNRPGDAPLFTEDSAMLVVDDWLRQHDSYVPVTRDEFRWHLPISRTRVSLRRYASATTRRRSSSCGAGGPDT
jgi:hypothetical protein